MRNLCIMIVNWSTCSFGYYLLLFYIRYFKGLTYGNAALLGLADIIATVAVRILQIYFETKTGFVIWFSVTFLVSILYYFVSHITVMVAICVLLMRFGITSSFSFSYYANAEYFQTDFTSTAFGICNTSARFFTIISPMMAEILPQPIILITIFTFIAGICSMFLIKPKNILISQIENARAMQRGVEDNLPDVVRDFYNGNEDPGKI